MTSETVEQTPHARYSEHAGLTPEEVAFYRDEGYLVVRGVFSPEEVARLAADADEVVRARTDLIDANNMRVRFKNHHETNEILFEVFDPISDLSPVASAIAHDRRILDRLHDLYGEPAELFKDKLIYKPVGATGAVLHQDWIAWPMDGQHHYVELGDLPTEPVPLLMESGDVAIFTCFTPHRSGANVSQITRRGYFISYNARSDGGQQHAKHYREFHEWLRGKAPAEKRAAMFFR